MRKLGLVWIGVFLFALFTAIHSEPVGNEIGTYRLFAPAARTTTVGTYGSPVYDRSGFRSGVGLWQSAVSSAGSACSAYVSLQESDAATTGYVDNMVASTADSVSLRDNVARTRLAFQMTQTAARTISSVTVKMRTQGAPTGTNGVILTIMTDNSGAPSGTAVHADAIDTVLISSLSSTWAWVTFNFDRPVDLAASTVYHFVLSGNYTVSATNFTRLYVETVASGGDIEVDNNGTWGDVATQDVVGKTLQYNFTNITSAQFDTATHAVSAFDTKDVNLRGKKRYVRAKATIVGTSGSFVSSGALILGEPLNKPVED